MKSLPNTLSSKGATTGLHEQHLEARTINGVKFTARLYVIASPWSNSTRAIETCVLVHYTAFSE